MNSQQLNNLVNKYQSDRSDETFAQIYAMVSTNWRNLRAVGKSVLADEAEITAVYEDALLRCLDIWNPVGDFEHFLNQSIKRRRSDIYRKKKRLSEFEVFAAPVENEDGSEAANFEIEDEFNLEDHITAKKRAHQRQLIDSLLNGADAKTTAIVEAFLASEKPTPTAIGEALGLHHSTVIRTLKRLAGKFDSKQYGDHSDYLVAL
jgi:DNA-directed RNA polymerase specialized sigma24 family protein